MIIWGSKGRVRSVGSGTFNCPHCSAPRQYEHKKLQSWFTLYFIPVFPTSTLSEYIACNACETTYQMTVLDYDPAKLVAAREAGTLKQWRNAMIYVACAFGPGDERQAEAIANGIRLHLNKDESVNGLAVDCRNAPGSGAVRDDIRERIRALAGELDHQGKENFLMSALEVVQAGDANPDHQDELLRDVGEALGLSAAHVRGVLISASEGIAPAEA